MEPIEITMTATRRPEIIERTIRSFRRYLFTDDIQKYVTLRINIDPIPYDIDYRAPYDIDYRAIDVIRIYITCKLYFDNVVMYFPSEPSFPRATLRLWREVKTRFFWNIEDDWELLRPVNLNKMLEIMTKDVRVAILRLPFRPVTSEHSKNWKWFFPWNGRFFKCPEAVKMEHGFCGHPSMIQTYFMNRFVDQISDKMDVEKQLKGHFTPFANVLQYYDIGVYSEPGMPEAIRDIGREWREKRGLVKTGINSKTFETWRR